MEKPTIFYFVHAHGNGHRAIFNLLYPELSEFFNVIAVTTNEEVTEYLQWNHRVEILQLPPKYPPNYEIPEHTFSKAFEMTPYEIEPAFRAKSFAEAIIKYQPKAFYCDGVPEIAIMSRSMGLPVVLVHLPGNIIQDPTQVFAHELADHIVAHFPASLEQENYRFATKTFYSGYLSKYFQENLIQNKSLNENPVTIILGYDNYDESVLRNITSDLNTKFTVIGNKRKYNLAENCVQLGRVKNISDGISGKIVISAAGQNTVAEMFSLNKTLILLPESRPYDEQKIHAEILAEEGIALLAKENFTAQDWKNILSEAKSFKPLNKNVVNPFAAKEIAQKMNNWYA
ncbi:hypothetical protein ASG01_09215 [Chryseobacterium sp. Leaf180]|uniref:glycosyltransferase n=1 Tax=Chryseobacterium sp. Leaf180 TaxID=1736289 RepID=UPI0006F89098|nr:glycosyltransferase [Chryseobacterium sp. Leaf180]KQR93360.1 hypothetical protein ASG01_09215 [Chryseobacterium sp. Leaf180]